MEEILLAIARLDESESFANDAPILPVTDAMRELRGCRANPTVESATAKYAGILHDLPTVRARLRPRMGSGGRLRKTFPAYAISGIFGSCGS
jgi:hypothetical protein